MKTIAVIDDDIHIGNMLEELLQREGYAVVRAYSGTEAVLLLERVRPDLVLLDLMLPGLPGEEVLVQIRGIPVMVVSAKVGVDDKVKLLLNGAVDYVTKPFDTRELLARIAVRLRESSAPGLAPVLEAGPPAPGPDRPHRHSGGPARPADQDGVRHFEAVSPKPRPGHRQVGDPGPHLRRHSRLHRELAEDPHQQPAKKAAGRHRTGPHRVGVGDRI